MMPWRLMQGMNLDCQKSSARPIQASLASALTFALVALPLVVIMISPVSILVPSVAIMSLVFLSLMGAIAARMGGASVVRGAMRVTFWGALAMAATALIGKLFGTAV